MNSRWNAPRPDVGIVAERPEDMAAVAAAAARLRRAGIVVDAPLGYSRPKRRFATLRTADGTMASPPWRTLVIDGDRAAILGDGQGVRIETDPMRATAILIDADDDVQTTPEADALLQAEYDAFRARCTPYRFVLAA